MPTEIVNYDDYGYIFSPSLCKPSVSETIPKTGHFMSKIMNEDNAAKEMEGFNLMKSIDIDFQHIFNTDYKKCETSLFSKTHKEMITQKLKEQNETHFNVDESLFQLEMNSYHTQGYYIINEFIYLYVDEYLDLYHFLSSLSQLFDSILFFHENNIAHNQYAKNTIIYNKNEKKIKLISFMHVRQTDNSDELEHDKKQLILSLLQIFEFISNQILMQQTYEDSFQDELDVEKPKSLTAWMYNAATDDKTFDDLDEFISSILSNPNKYHKYHNETIRLAKFHQNIMSHSQTVNELFNLLKKYYHQNDIIAIGTLRKEYDQILKRIYPLHKTVEGDKQADRTIQDLTDRTNEAKQKIDTLTKDIKTQNDRIKNIAKEKGILIEPDPEEEKLLQDIKNLNNKLPPSRKKLPTSKKLPPSKPFKGGKTKRKTKLRTRNKKLRSNKKRRHGKKTYKKRKTTRRK